MRHLQSFTYVKAIVDTGSIRGAAENLNISPSALNRHIQSLELDLDIKVFDRLSRGVRLSAEGEIFYNFALSQLSGFAHVRNQINNIKGLSIGSLKIGVSHDLHFGFMHRLVGQFQSEFHNVDIEVIPVAQNDLFNMLRGGTIDIAIVANPVLRGGLNVMHARDVELAAFVPLGIGLGNSGHLRVYELQNMRVALPPPTSQIASRVISACEKHKIDVVHHYSGLNPVDYLEYSNLPVVGISAVLEDAPDQLQVAGYKRVPLDEKELGTCSVAMLSNEDRGIQPLAYKFQEIASAYFQ